MIIEMSSLSCAILHICLNMQFVMCHFAYLGKYAFWQRHFAYLTEYAICHVPFCIFD